MLRALGGAGTVLLMAGVLAGCGKNTSIMSPEGPKAHTVDVAWWILLAVAGFVCLAVMVLAVLPLVLRRRRATIDQSEGTRFVVVFGAVLPTLVFAGCFALGIHALVANDQPGRRPAVTIDVIGHQWWWEVRYPDAGAVTANEIHVPVGEPVEVRLTTADVIHSFWIPEITPKTDVLPRRVNQTWLTVDKAGTYHGECAEYCGLQHAHMGFDLIAQSPSTFQSWLQLQARAAQPPTTATARDGEQVFLGSSCATCHTIRGTAAGGQVGPDLTHVGGRARLAGGTIPNTPADMTDWVHDSQSIKPGNRMPQQPLSPTELHAVVAYLQGLR